MISISLLALISFLIITIMVQAALGPKEPWDPDLEAGTLSILGRRKDKLLRILKDIDDEREMGSIEEAEYLQLRRSYKAKAVVALREFDRVRETRLRKLKTGGIHVSAGIRGRIDDMVSQRKDKSAAREAEK
ncbi:MAG: hypothetical protein CMJ97_01155 [Planctomycetes bacterium]|nr:hypothetical protein [Planctomycetota bacterium]|tara:strand:- start:236 stop:631 length:396 start_codon:yes stop_codon:yes gene_type:complete